MLVQAVRATEGRRRVSASQSSGENRPYAEVLQDKIQAMRLSGDAMATALAGLIGPDHELIRMWDEAKRHGEKP